MPRLPQTRQSLLLELARCSDGAWTEFIGIYESAIAAYCRTLGLQESDVHDATQEVLAAVHHRIPTWDANEARGSFRAWLFRVARNCAVDLIASRARQHTLELPSIADVHLNPREQHEHWLDLAYERAMLHWAATQVKAEVRSDVWDAFELTAGRGLSASAVAGQLSMSVGSVYAAKCRVTARLRDKVEHLERQVDDRSGPGFDLNSLAEHNAVFPSSPGHNHDANGVQR